MPKKKKSKSSAYENAQKKAEKREKKKQRQRDAAAGGRAPRHTLPPKPKCMPLYLQSKLAAAAAVLRFSIASEMTIAKVKQRYKELVLKCHPDKGGNAEEFIRIHAAYEQVSSYFEKGIM